MAVDPYNACKPVKNEAQLAGKIAIIRRGDCMFQEKVKHVQEVGAIAAIIIG
jgi:mannosidase alpha-like ER degradation enhancer 3